MGLSASFFGSRFGITEHDLEPYLSEALSAGGDYADLYFEYLATSSIGIDEGIVKSATQGVTLGVGVRVIAGERTGYAYSDDLSPEKIRKAARVAACIARGPASVVKTGFEEAQRHNLYPMLRAPHETGLDERVDLVKRADRAARAYDPRVFQVQATYADSLRHVLVATSDGRLSFDRQPMARMSVSALARQGDGDPQQGHAGGGGRVTLDFFLNEKTPEHFASEAARQAIVQLDAVEAPAGEMTVVLGPGWPGILLHEAVGHGLEADFNRKRRLGVQRAHRPAGGEPSVHRDRRRHHRQPARIAQRGRRRHRPRSECADRKRRPARLPAGQAFEPPDAVAVDRQRAARKLSAHPHAAHDQHLHAGGRERSGRDHPLGAARASTARSSAAGRWISPAAISCSRRPRAT